MVLDPVTLQIEWEVKGIKEKRQQGKQIHDRRQTAIDGGGLETLFALQRNKVVYLSKRNFPRWTIPHCLGEEAQIIAVIFPGARSGAASAHPIDETFDFD